MSTSTTTTQRKRASGWSGRLTPDQFADLVAAGVAAGCQPLYERVAALEARPVEGEKLTRDYSVEAPARAAELGARVAALEARLVTVEERPAGLAYRGVWEAEATYRVGDVVTRQGSMWVSKLNENHAMPGEAPSAWALSVKHGRNGRDLRAAG